MIILSFKAFITLVKMIKLFVHTDLCSFPLLHGIENHSIWLRWPNSQRQFLSPGSLPVTFIVCVQLIDPLYVNPEP